MNEVEARLRHIIQKAIDDHPRSQQKEIGPSEIGKKCSRWLGYRLLDIEPANPRTGAWRPTVGTAVHNWLSAVFMDAGYLTEHRVTIGELRGPDGYDIYGSGDLLFDCTTIDWKIVGKTTLDKARRAKARGECHDPQYRVQAHGYGKGYVDQNLPVYDVAIFYLPAAGELGDAVYWTEPYDRSVAEDALTRVNAVKSLVDNSGPLALTLLPSADDYCQWCSYFKPESTDLARGCPGHNPAPPKSIADSLME